MELEGSCRFRSAEWMACSILHENAPMLIAMKHSASFAVLSLVLLGLLALPSARLLADEAALGRRGEVLQAQGDVRVVNAWGAARRLTKKGETIRPNETVVTGKGGRVVMQFNDGAMTVLGEQSRLKVEKKNWFSYIGGKIYFTFKKVFGERRHIRTRAATIGVRGTTFIVSESERGEQVALKEGKLQFDSTGPSFEIHRRKQADEFARFKQEYEKAKKDTLNEFERYRQQMQREFIEYRRSFTLKANRQLVFSGYRVDEAPLDADSSADFAAFEAEAGQWLKSFHQAGNKSSVNKTDK